MNANVIINSFLYTIISYSTPLILCTLGGQVTQQVGRLNLGMEGMMMFSAFFSLYFTYLTGSMVTGILISCTIVALISMLMVFLNIKMGVDMFIAGLAMNTLGSGLTTYLIKVVAHSDGTLDYTGVVERMPVLKTPILDNIPYVNQVLSNHNALDYIAILLVIVMAVIYNRTTLGRHIRATGQSNWVAQSRGISVEKTVYIAYIMGGVLMALAGASLSLPLASCSAGSSGMTNCRGWTAMAVIILSRGNPYVALVASWLLGALFAIGSVGEGLGLINTHVTYVLPFVGALIMSCIYSARQAKVEQL